MYALISFLDQVFFSAANFLLSVFLARELTSSDYALFSIIISWGILVNSILMSIFLEGGLWRANVMRSLSIEMGSVGLLSAGLIGSVVGFFVWYFFSSLLPLYSVVYGVSFSLIFYCRKMLVLTNRAWSAFFLSIAYIFVVIAVIIIVLINSHVSVGSIVGCLSIFTVAICFILTLRFNGELREFRLFSSFEGVRDWGWMLPSAVFMWLQSNIIFVLPQYAGDFILAGDVRLYLNILTPILMLNQVVSIVLIRYITSGRPYRNLMAFIGLANLMYVLILYLYAGSIFSFLYPGRVYMLEMKVWLLVPFATYVASYLFSIARTKFDYSGIFISYGFSAFVTCIVSIFLLRAGYEFSLDGLFGVMFLTNILAVLVIYWRFRVYRVG